MESSKKRKGDVIDLFETSINWLKALAVTTIAMENVLLAGHVAMQLFELDAIKDFGLMAIETWIVLANCIILLSFGRMWKAEYKVEMREDAES